MTFVIPQGNKKVRKMGRKSSMRRKKAVADVWLGEPETSVSDLEEFNIKLDGKTPLYILYSSVEHDFPVIGTRPVSEEDMKRLYQENEEREEEE